ncbi:DUF2971 domain-containing protein [Burkholderia gladioli]|uniref:DUF2971 domain-containing protein n=1 Tax=Burkholderia gladioli TaxID=28095 RepID=UPI00163E16B3|nr:DUF2971 domain-containing protein [Burkholderia gladioli]
MLTLQLLSKKFSRLREFLNISISIIGGAMLYKFLGDVAHNDRDFKTLEQEKIHASHFSSLNDPWDAPNNFLDPSVIERLSNSPAKKLADDFFYDINNFGIYCLSTEKSSQLMWAHYANNWKGLCIEYNAPDPGKFFYKLREIHNSMVLISALSMRYADFPLYADIEDFKKENALNLIRKLFSQKNVAWSYEKEFRLFFKKSQQYHIPASLVSGVYLGHAMAAAQKEKYLAMLSGKKIPVWIAYPDKANFRGGVRVERLG